MEGEWCLETKWRWNPVCSQEGFLREVVIGLIMPFGVREREPVEKTKFSSASMPRL